VLSTRIAAFLLGAWLCGGLFMGFVATQNFATVDRVLAVPPQSAAPMIQSLGYDQARQLLRYLAGEENRLFFGDWELVQLGLGLALVCVLFSGVGNPLIAGLAAVLLLLTGFQHFMVTAQLLTLGRSIDFVSPEAQSAARNSFWKLHALYGGIEVAKLALVLVLTGVVLIRGRRGNSQSRIEAEQDYSTSSATTGRPGSKAVRDLIP
jgi:hypothetical protein